jgi:phospholipid/cholesterol/gamma-HCH transport system substrate-binding protein
VPLPENDEKHLELKVGAVILSAVVLLIAFILLLSDFSFKSRKDLLVYFKNPGGLSPGAAVKVAGRKAGTVEEMTFIGRDGPVNPLDKKPSLVKVMIQIDEDLYQSLRVDARFYITTKGVLGDPFLEIDPGTTQQAYDEKSPLFGVDPPRIDLFIADTYELIRGLNGVLDRNAEHLDTLLSGGARLVGAVDRALEVDGGVNMGRVNTVFDNVDALVADTRNLVNGVNKRFVEDPGVGRTLKNMESLTSKLNTDIGPLLTEIKSALAEMERIASTLGPEEQRRVKSAIANLDDISSRTDKLIARGDAIMSKLERGEGTVGRLLEDDEIYDDLKELIRDIKRHPWKIIWQD